MNIYNENKALLVSVPGDTLEGADLYGADLRGADLSGVDLRGADLSWANLDGANLNGAALPFGVPRVNQLHSKILMGIEHEPESFDMSKWHSECGTAHCWAGWIVTLAGLSGADLARRCGTAVAAALIAVESTPALNGKVPDFYSSNETAIAEIRRLAALEL